MIPAPGAAVEMTGWFKLDRVPIEVSLTYRQSSLWLNVLPFSLAPNVEEPLPALADESVKSCNQQTGVLVNYPSSLFSNLT